MRRRVRGTSGLPDWCAIDAPQTGSSPECRSSHVILSPARTRDYNWGLQLQPTAVRWCVASKPWTV